MLQGLSIEAIEAADALVVSKNLAFANFFFFGNVCCVVFPIYWRFVKGDDGGTAVVFAMVM